MGGQQGQDYYRRNVAHIVDVVSTYYGVSPNDVFKKGRTQSLSKARQVCMYLARIMLGFSYPEIGKAFGNRDHTTTRNACKRIIHERLKDERFNEEVDSLVDLIQTGQLHVPQIGTAINFPDRVWERLKTLRASGMFGDNMAEVVIRLVSTKLYELDYGTTQVRDNLYATGDYDESSEHVQPPSSRLRHNEP